MKRALAGLAIAATILAGGASPAHASPTPVRHHDSCEYDGDCGDYGGYQGRDDDGGYEYRRGGNGSQGDCQSGGCGNKSRRCDRSSGDCRSSFSPGPFKDSPVVICAPYSCNSGSGDQSGGNRSGQGDEQPQSLGCAVPVPFHCDPKPEKPTSLTDPTKLPQVIATIVKSGLDMGQLFATTTIKFVEDLFIALA